MCGSGSDSDFYASADNLIQNVPSATSAGLSLSKFCSPKALDLFVEGKANTYLREDRCRNMYRIYRSIVIHYSTYISFLIVWLAYLYAGRPAPGDSQCDIYLMQELSNARNDLDLRLSTENPFQTVSPIK